MPWGREAGLCFRCLELCLCFHLIEPSGRRLVAVASLSRRRCRVAVASPSRRCRVAAVALLSRRRCRVAVVQVARTTPIKTLF